MSSVTAPETWVSKSEARRRLATSMSRVDALIASGMLGTRQVAGGFTRISAVDVERVLAESTRPATSTQD